MIDFWQQKDFALPKGIWMIYVISLFNHCDALVMGSTVLLLETGESVEQGGQLLRVDGQQEVLLRAGGQQGGGGGGRQQQRWRLRTHLHPQTWWKADLGHIRGRRHKPSRGWPCGGKKIHFVLHQHDEEGILQDL